MNTYPTGAFAESLIEYQRLRIQALSDEIHRLTEENSRNKHQTPNNKQTNKQTNQPTNKQTNKQPTKQANIQSR